MAKTPEEKKKKSDQQMDRLRRRSAATREAMQLLSEAMPAGEVFQHVQKKHRLTEYAADIVMRDALTRLLPEFGYLDSQIKATCQNALRNLVANSGQESTRLRAATRLRRHFSEKQQVDRSEVPEVIRKLDQLTVVDMTAASSRLGKEWKLSMWKSRRRLRKLSAHWERHIPDKKLTWRTHRKYHDRLKEVIILLSHPFRSAEIVEIMKKRHGMQTHHIEAMITEASKTIEKQTNLHPLQVELINQRLAVTIIKSRESTDQSKLLAVETLLQSAPADATRGDAEDAVAMQLRARVMKRDELLGDELQALLDELWKDAKRRWGWEPS